MKKAIYLLFSSAFMFGQVNAMNDGLCKGEMAVTLGYRSDRLESDVNVFEPPGIFSFSDDLKGTSINIYEVGFKGGLLICDSWLIRGYIDTGEVHRGDYEEGGLLADGQSYLPALGKVCKGHSYDTSIGAGYLYSWWPCLSFGPVAGYSYDYLKIKMSKVRIDGTFDPVLSGLRHDMRWQGPWIGVDARYRVRCFDVVLGYEFHWSHWHSSFTLDGPDVFGVAFSDKRKSTHANGNVAFIDAAYTLSRCWNLGLGFKYQYWRAKHGGLVPKHGTLADVGFGNISNKVRQAIWCSYQFQLFVGYLF